MKTLGKTLGLFVRLSISATALLITQQAVAELGDTNFNTPVSNTAVVDYDVAGTGFTETSPAEVFVVDRKVNFLVEEVDSLPTPTTLGATGNLNYVEYRVTNLTNGTMDFTLSVLSPQVGAPTDQFDMTIVSVEADDGNDPFTGGNYIDDLAEDASVLVRIYATTPASGPVDGDISQLTLVASAADANTELTEQATWTKGAVDNVFANASGADPGTGFATETADDTFELAAPVVDVTKLAAVISDPFSSGTPKAIPGAIMEYTITIDNSGNDTASNISIGDIIDPSVELVEQVAGISTITITDDGGTQTTCNAEVGGADTNGDGCFYSAAAIGPVAARTLTVAGLNTAGAPINVPGLQTWTVSFQVTIQ